MTSFDASILQTNKSAMGPHSDEMSDGERGGGQQTNAQLSDGFLLLSLILESPPCHLLETKLIRDEKQTHMKTRSRSTYSKGLSYVSAIFGRSFKVGA